MCVSSLDGIITSGMIRMYPVQLVKEYWFLYMTLAVDITDGHGFSNEACH